MTSQAIRNRSDYMITCINEFAHNNKLTKKDAYNYLKSNKALEFLKDNYEAEHTLSIQDAVDDMRVICRRNGGML